MVISVISASIVIAGLFSMIFGYFVGRISSNHTIRRLRKSNSELITDLKTGTTITTNQRDEYNRIVAEHKVLNEEQNNIIVFIRDQFPQYLDGRFNSFSQLVIGIFKSGQQVH